MTTHRHEPATILDMLRSHADHTPDRVAYTFVADRDEKNVSWTYGELDRRARAIGEALVQRSATGRPVLLLYPQGLEYIAAFFGCLYAGAIAVPAYPPDPKRMTRTLPRLQAIIADSGAPFALTIGAISQMIAAAGESEPVLSRLEWIASDELESAPGKGWAHAVPRAEMLAFLQYTSGSTATPKGVMVSHGNLLHNIEAAYERLEHDSNSTMVSWLPAYHDMGLIGGILQPLFGGFRGYVMAPLTFLKRPFRWLETITRAEGFVTSVAPNFAYDLCVRKLTDESRAKLDLTRWRLAMTGAEPVRASTMEAFSEAFASCGFRRSAFYPCYGLAEGTLMISGGVPAEPFVTSVLAAEALERHRIRELSPAAEPAADRNLTLVGAGHITRDNTVLIVDPETRRLCAPDEVGEIWASGPSIARGYWRRREDTERVFGARPEPSDGRTYLRTGDLGFFRGRQLFIAGRLKDLLIVRGRNIHPQDVELTVQRVGRQLRAGSGATFSIEVDGREEVVIAQELEPGGAAVADDLLARIRQAVADDHELTPHAVLLLKAGAIPKTTSGKIQRRATKKELLALSLDVVAASVAVDTDVSPASLSPAAVAFGGLAGDVKRRVIETWIEEMLPGAKGRAAGATFADLGATYADLQRIVASAFQRFGVHVPLGRMLAHPSVSALLDAIAPVAAPESDAPLPTLPARTAEEIHTWLVGRVAASLGLSTSAIDTSRPFQELGLDSAHAVTIADGLSAWLGRRVPQTLVWDHPTIDAAARALSLPAARAEAGRDDASAPPADDREAIAIVGMGCRFPGAPNVDAFWRLLRDGRDAVGEVPPSRWNMDALYDPTPGVPGKIVTRWGAFLDRIDGFDAPFFSLSLREAVRVDPQQRLLLEVAWEALEDAGEPVDGLSGSDTGVFVGISNHDYSSLLFEDPTTLDAHTGSGNALSIAANRLSYVFDLKGPSMAVDTACSASLVAVHTACESLLRGECSRALVAGVNLIVTPHLSIVFSQAKMLSPDGRCKTFDDRADGYVRGEGCGVVVLKRLSDALKSGDRVLAVIAGSAINHDGRSNGLTAPNGSAQRAVIQRALARANVKPQEVGYVEAHGTGTALGDPIELEALASVYGRGRPAGESCLVGSVKTNIGHLEAAAGIAGLMKATLAIASGHVPAHLHLKTPNERMAWRDSNLSIPTHLTPWTGPRVAAVSSFGFGGANAHVVLRDAPEPRARVAPAPPAIALAISARTETALNELGKRYAQHLQASSSQELRDVGFTACAGRSALPHRCVVIGSTAEQLHKQLRNDADADGASAIFRSPRPRREKPRVAFLFTGQGAQYPEMGRSLFDVHPLVRDTLTRADAVLRPHLGLSLLERLFSKDPEALTPTRVQQPALFALQVALGRVLTSWGITPEIVLGHSIGEYAAAYFADAFDFEDGLLLVAERAKLMGAQPPGAMLVCLGDVAKVDAAVKRVTSRGGVASVAVRNAPKNVVVSGERGAIDDVARELELADVPSKRLNVSHAFHSALMDGALDAFEAAAAKARFSQPRIPVVSNLTGDLHFDDVAPDPRYWRNQMREPVKFEAGVRTLLARGCDVFVEVGPGATLLNLARATMGPNATEHTLLPCLKQGRPEWSSLLSVPAQLFVLGAEIDWEAVYAPFDPRRVALPTYPFERTRVWFDPPAKRGSSEEPMTTPPAPAAPLEAPSLAPLLSMLREQAVALSALARASGAGDIASAVESTSGPSESAVHDVALRQVSLVSGFPVGQISLDSRLGADLGFDSLMKSELDRRLVAQFPDLSRSDRKSLPEDPRVSEIVALVRRVAATSARYEPVERVAPPPPVRETNGHVRESALRFSDWPEVRALEARLEAARASGAVPYGRIHESFNSGRARIEGKDVLNFSAFNYAGLSNDPRVREEAKRAIDRYGTSTSATPLLFGETPLHHELEAEVARFLGTEAAIVFASGHATNVATVGHMFGPPDLIVHDQLIHDSTVRGCMLAGAKRRPFKHNDWRDLDRILGAMRNQHRRALIVLEGVYSQDGDFPDLPRFIELREKYDAMLMIDEAHSIGVMGPTGRGVGEHFGVARDSVDLWMGTLSKGLGSCGGYIAAREPIVQYLKFTTPLFIFSTGISPANAAAALAALRVLQAEPERVRNVQKLSAMFLEYARSRGLDTGISKGSSIIPIIVGDWGKTMHVSNSLLGRGINVMPIGAPAVDKDACRLRFFINADHTEADLRRAVDAVAEELGSSAPKSKAARTNGNGSNGNSNGSPSNKMVRTNHSEGANVLVTGATGFIGSHLVRALSQRGERVRVLVRSSSDRTALPAGVEVVEGALEDLPSVRSAMRGIRWVYNCAGLSADWGAWERFYAANVRGVEHLLAAAEEVGHIERFVHLSTSDVYGYPTTACNETGELRDVGLPYNRSKVSGELLVWDAHRRGLPVTVIRPVTVYGPRSKDWVIEIANLLCKGEMVLIDGGRVSAGLLYIDNAVEGILAAARSPNANGQAYNLRDGTARTWKEYTAALADGLGTNPVKRSIPSTVALGVARTSELVYGGLSMRSRPLLTRHAVYLMSRDQSYPVEKAKQDFGFSPSVSFEQGIERTLAWLGTPSGLAAVPRS